MRWKVLATVALMLFMAWLFTYLGGSRLGEGSEWLWALTGAILGLYLVKPFGRLRRERPGEDDDVAADSYASRGSPRAQMERRWRRLGSARGSLLSEVDQQSDLSEALYRLEYGPKASGDDTWLPPQDKAQAYDLQMPLGIRKRKRKPKPWRNGRA